MRKISLLILYLGFFTNNLFAQDFDQVDSIVMTYPATFKNPEKFAERLSQDFTSDLEKVRGIYTWITTNIYYDMREFKRYSYSYISLSDKRKKEIWHNRKVSKKTVSKGRAVCHGYALLFKATCDELGIKSSYISGLGKGGFKDIGRAFLLSRHAWNMVEIDGKRYLLDVTWAAGKYRQFRKVFEFLFLTPPELFIRNHFPDNVEYSLLEITFSKNYFIKAPLYHLSKYSKVIHVVSPLNGILNISATKKKIFKFKGTDDIYMVSYKIGDKITEIKDFKTIDNALELEIDFSNKIGDLITFIFNNQSIVTYRLIYP
jgi:transglutaminase/protease-like cytokinesis protein 3